MQYNNQPNEKDITEKTQTMINHKGFIISPEDSQTITNQPTRSQDTRQTMINPQDSHQTMINVQDSDQTMFESLGVASSNETLAEKNDVPERTMLELQPTNNVSHTTYAQVQDNMKQQTSVPKMFANKYQIVSVLGTGAMGKVFEAIQVGKNQRFAIKVIHKNKEGSQEIVKRFYRESELLAKLNHPNIINIHEHGEFQGQPYFVMDLVKGTTFTQIIQQPNYPLRRKLILLTQVLEAVHSAHVEGIIHRDLKPENIMVTDNGKALVMDFGIARDQGDSHSTKLTKTGMLVGTPLYMSPEQINGEKITAKSDIYTLGVIMYQVITGKVPFEGNLSKIMWQIAHSDPVHPREISDNIPKNLAAICLKAMVKEQEERYSTARAMANDIKRYLKGQKISIKHSFDAKKWITQNYRKLLMSIILICVSLFFVFGNNKKDDNSFDMTQSNDNMQNLPDENQSHNQRNSIQNDSNSKNDVQDNSSVINEKPNSVDQQKHHREDNRDDRRHPRRDRFSSNEDNHDDRRPPRHDRFSNSEGKRDDRRHPRRDRFSNSEDNRDDRRPPHNDRFSNSEDNRDDRRHHDRFSNSEDNRDDKRPPHNNRFSNSEDNRDDRRPHERFSRGNKPTPDERMMNHHFRYCNKCRNLIRKNRINIGGPPPNWSKVPAKILKEIKKHAQNDK